MSKKYYKELNKVLVSAGYNLKRKKNHLLYFNEDLGKTVTASSTTKDYYSLDKIKMNIRRNRVSNLSM